MAENFGNRSAGAGVSNEEWNRFESLALPNLDAAYNLARWLTGNEEDANDVVQEAYARALEAFDSFPSGDDFKPWVLAFVKNTSKTWVRRDRQFPEALVFCEEQQDLTPAFVDSENAILANGDAITARHALQNISMEFLEVLILREMEGLTYKVIAELIGIPVGTVMSRLSRARREVSHQLRRRAREENS